MVCIFQLKDRPDFQFAFGETHLKAKPEFMGTRLEQTTAIVKHFSENYRSIPAFMGGDFNEEPSKDPISKVMNSAF